MTVEERRQSIQLEMEAGHEAVDAAKSLVEKDLYRSAMSRAYFGLFHYIKALLYTQGLEPKSHEELEHLFGFHFVKSGKVDIKSAKLLARLQKYCERSDYGLVSVFSTEDVEEELTEVEHFINSIQGYLKI